MPDNYQEIEVKLLVPDLSAVAARLVELGAELASERVYERNIRYENADNTLKDNGIVLRLRQDTRARLTYKEPPAAESAGRGVHNRFEAEVTVSDLDAMDTILGRLGFHPLMSYEKYRTTYTLDDAEIVLDEMPYGTFVEIEADAEDAINALVARLGLTDAPRMGYSYSQLFDHVRANLNLNMEDLTFADFEGVDVLASAFEPPHGGKA